MAVYSVWMSPYCVVYFVYSNPDMPEGKRSLEYLPFSVVRRLTQYLDRQFPEHHNWMSFLQHAEIIGKWKFDFVRLMLPPRVHNIDTTYCFNACITRLPK